MNVPILDLTPQYLSLKQELHKAIERVMDSGQFIMGPDVKLFEQEVAAYLGVKHAIGVNSGTDALVIGLKALGLGQGDEIITTPFSFFATAESISQVGATPVFADIDPISFNLDPEMILSKISSKTRAILPVHLYGHPAAMEQILAIAQRYQLKVIEDCAQSFGARYLGQNKLSGKFTGTLGEVGAFSFFPSKNLGAYGDGGLLVTDDDQVAERARMLRVHGTKKKYHNELLGYNSRLDTLQAAILRVKLPYIDTWNEQRRQVAKCYNHFLSELPHLLTPTWDEGHVFHQYTIRILGGKRDEVQKYLESHGVHTMVYYPVPQDQLPVYRGQYPENPMSDLAAREVLSLPIWPEIDPEILRYIVHTLQEALNEDWNLREIIH